MGEKVSSRLYRTFQESPNLSSVWRPGKVGRTTLLSANSDNNYMGRSSPPLDESRNENENEVIQTNEASRPEKFSFPNANDLGKHNYDDGTEYIWSPNSSKCDGINERRKDREIYVRDISPQRNNYRNNNERHGAHEQRINSSNESETYSDITMVPLECCPNGRRIRKMQLSLGELCRVGTFSGNARTEEKPKTPCHFVVPNVQSKKRLFSETMSHVSMDEKKDETQEEIPTHVSMDEKKDETQEDCKIPKNPFITVEMIANKLDRKHAAESLGRHVGNRNPAYQFYLEVIKAYGFDHVILIGECYAGILFLDCYGRLFEWGDMMDVLWPLGDYWSVLSSGSSTRRGVVWGVENDGTISEFEDNLPKPATNPMDAKKKKNSKKKNSKKKH